MWRIIFWLASLLIFGAVGVFHSYGFKYALHTLVFIVPVFLLGIFDVFQGGRNVLRNFPVVGHMRYLLLGIRPEIQQYFIETNQSGKPYSDEIRKLIHERANREQDTIPFGTQRDLYSVGYEWINHSITPTVLEESERRVIVGGPGCKQPYSASLLNISAMSFGALSAQAIKTLNRGAHLGNFAHNTGEGGLSKHHLAEGGDIIWQIGTAYFGCRTPGGRFDADQFSKKACLDVVKMIEIKISQGAKPAHGGVLPKEKITEEISHTRGVPMGEDCLSPPGHAEFSTPTQLLQFVDKLRRLSGGKPVGFKLCVGSKVEFMCICKAMLETNILPDFITVDGGEGGTGAAPVEFIDFIGTPLNESLAFVHNCLVGIDLRKDIRIVASGKISNGFGMAKAVALGADMFNAAREMMFAMGCIQSRSCNTNKCPTGIATQDPRRAYAINISDKAPKVHQFHDATIDSLMEVLGAAGIDRVLDLKASRIHRRVNQTEVKSFSELFDFCKPGSFLHEVASPFYLKLWKQAKADQFTREGDSCGH